MKATFVIIGGGIAGVSCAEQLAYLVPEEQILLISATSMVKKVTNLNRIAQIINTFDVEETDKKDLENDHTNLKVIQGHVTEIDSKKREITLKTGNRIQYHYVLLCHGARPKLVSNDKYIFGIRDTESVQKFQDNLKDARKIVIVGNGGIATEMVHELKNVEIVWIIKDSSIAATFVDPGAGQFFLEEMFKNEKEEETVPATKRSKYTAKEFKSQSNGTFGGALGPDWHSHLDVQGCLESEKKVTLETQAGIETIVENAEDEFKVLVTLTNGKVIKCDLVVSATGVIPNGDTIKIDDIILDSDNAITVNDQMETNF